MSDIDIVDPGTLCVLCQIDAIAAHVAEPAVGFLMDDLKAVSDRLKKARFQVECAIALKVFRGTDIPRFDDGSAGQAKRRLADEYDAAQERGEVAKNGDNLPSVPKQNSKPTANDIGLSRKDIHEARTIRDAEQVDPGIYDRPSATPMEAIRRAAQVVKARNAAKATEEITDGGAA